MPDTLGCRFIGNCDAVTVETVLDDTQNHKDTSLLKDIITLALVAHSQNTIAAKQFLEYLTAKHSFDYQRSVLLKTTTLLPSAKPWLQQIYG